MRAAIIGAECSSCSRDQQASCPSVPDADNLVQIGILVWLGLLVVAFGAKNWIRRRWPANGALGTPRP